MKICYGQDRYEERIGQGLLLASEVVLQQFQQCNGHVFSLERPLYQDELHMMYIYDIEDLHESILQH